MILLKSSPATALTGTGLGGSSLAHGMYEAGASSVTIDGTVGGATNLWRGFGFNVPASGGTNTTLTAEHGLLNLNGQSISFKFTASAEAGIYTLNGQEVLFTHNAITQYSLLAEHGTYTISGQDVDFTLLEAGSYNLLLDPGTLTFSVPEAYSAIGTTVEPGTLTFNGQNIDGSLEEPIDYTETIERGLIQFNGRPINLIWSGAPITNVAGTGLSISMRIGL